MCRAHSSCFTASPRPRGRGTACARICRPGRVVTPDLLGHGVAPNLQRVAFAAQLDVLDRVLPAAPVTLAGYSLGGRIALRWAVRSPERIARLVLIGANPGLADPAERSARRRSDEALAQAIETDGLDAWLSRWSEQSLFADQPAAVARRRRRGSPPQQRRRAWPRRCAGSARA